MTRQVLRSRARKQASTMLAELETMWPGASDQLTVNARRPALAATAMATTGGVISAM